MTRRTNTSGAEPFVSRTESVPSDGDEAAVRERAIAYVVDAVAVLGAVWALLRGRGWTLRRRVAACLAVGGVVGLPYHVLLEGAFGRTLGKRVLGVAVVTTDGEPCTYARAAVRTALRVVDWLPAAYLVGLLSIRSTERRQRVGDLLAGTVVVRTRERRRRTRD